MCSFSSSPLRPVPKPPATGNGLSPGPVKTRPLPSGFVTTRGAWSLNFLSICSTQKFAGSITCESADINRNCVMTVSCLYGSYRTCWSQPSSFRTLTIARAQHLPRERIADAALVVKRLAVDDHVLDAARGHYDAASAARQIVAHLPTLGRTNRVVIEHPHVCRHTRHQASTVLDAEEVGRLRSQSLDRTLETHHLPVAHPSAEQVGAVTRVAQH